MKTSRLLLSIVTVVAAGCSSQTFDPAAERTKLLKRDAEWADTATAGKDVEKIASYWSDDAVVVPPGQPVVEGKAAIRSFVTASLQTPGLKIHWSSDSVTFSPGGKLAYMRGTNETTLPGPDGSPMTLHGRALTIWRVDPDGQWRCVYDIWNDAPTAGAAASASQAPAPSDELAQIQQRLVRAWIDRDRPYVDSVLASDWTTTDPSGHVLTKAQIMREAFESGDRRVESGTIDDVKVRLLGDNTAIVTGRTAAVGSYKGKRVAVSLRFTDAFVKRDRRWQAVASQGTLIAP